MPQGGVYGDDYRPTYQLIVSGELNAESVDFYLATLFEWDQEDPEATWKILINCPGGETESGTALYEELCAYSRRGGGTHEIVTVAAGQCASMATLLMQAGDWRVSGEATTWLFHMPETGVGETMQTMADAAADLDHLKKWMKITDAMLLERTNLTPDCYYKQITGGMWLLTGHAAKTYGFVDEVR
ncbi:ClpP-like protease [Mycobacterium phage Wildcat]|uniref:ClpP-like protease n=4 Tax=Mycobacterium virus Wildcat TaxID=1993859 RepID=Q19XZ2_9CAUD|nr:hypothetical protein Wildcat_68 [Mycobacterium phage Wildcat]AJD82141.1 ClpP-like protease [Mycobacterium phage Cosmo]AQT25739.1 ClpP-like protease [Mycobacterium phage EniyanLRS]QGJ89956.1 ClpP-like protease [Mycobacterium phage MaryV]WKR36079.1 hypothetical protein [Mycobacterium phage Azrael100]ABE67673.1 ClpP-like protease [Mycobacterium phage Wildcat]